MRKITQEAIDAFMSGNAYNNGNTRVILYDKMYEDTNPKIGLELHGNKIAGRDLITGEIDITDAGWMTNTTQERLSGIPGVTLKRKAGVWQLNGKPWNGTYVRVSPNGEWVYL